MSLEDVGFATETVSLVAFDFARSFVTCYFADKMADSGRKFFVVDAVIFAFVYHKKCQACRFLMEENFVQEKCLFLLH